MLIRCATRMMTGMVFATGLAAGLTLGAGAVGAALVGKRMWEERKGWRAGAEAEAVPPAGEPGMDAPAA